jgi:alpha-L-fucosidase
MRKALCVVLGILAGLSLLACHSDRSDIHHSVPIPDLILNQGSVTIPAEAWTSKHGTVSVETIPVSGRKALGGIQAGDWGGRASVDFGQSNFVEAMARVEIGEDSAGCIIELRLDSPRGTLFGGFELEPTGGGIRECYTSLTEVKGVRDIYLVFPQKVNGKFYSLTLTSHRGAAAESIAQRDDRMAWWRGSRFGQFIHWGAYSQLGGSFRGTPTPRLGEWIMSQFQIPRVDYEAEAVEHFQPDRFDPEKWASLCAASGQRYMVITSKHHEGFALFDSQVEGFKELAGVRYYSLPAFWRSDRSPLRELAASCRKRGIRFGIYYSILDWHHSEQYPDPAGWRLTTTSSAGKVAYVQDMKDQLVELFQQCDPDIFWFDGEWVDWWGQEDGAELSRFLRSLKPAVIINNRVGKRLVTDGDFGTPEQVVPGSGLATDWESCMTLNNTWGFKAQDTNWKSSGAVIGILAETASKGGNLLLNVGPDGLGQIPESSESILRATGDWLKVNGEAIYGTQASCFPAALEWGWITTKTGRLYAHVIKWPTSGKLILPKLSNPVLTIRCISGGDPLEFQITVQGIEVVLPNFIPDPMNTVIVVDVDGDPKPAS